MKKNQTVQGTFSKLFGKKHANPPSTSLYATNPPWIFTQEAPEEGIRDFGGIYYGDNRFDSVSESGTATLKARPRVRPLLTFLPLDQLAEWRAASSTDCRSQSPLSEVSSDLKPSPARLASPCGSRTPPLFQTENHLETTAPPVMEMRPRVPRPLPTRRRNAQENHGLAVPTPSVPGDFADKEVTGTSSLVNGNLRLYSSARPRGHPQAFSSPPSPSCKREEEEDDDDEGEFCFEVIPPPPEFSNDPEPPAPALRYLGRRGSPPRNNFLDLGQPLAPRGFSRFPAGAHHAGAGGLERFAAGGGRSLIKKRLYVGEPQRSPGQPRGGTARSLSSPNCFGPPPGGPEMRRVNSAGRAPTGGLHAPRLSMEGAARGEAKFKAPGRDYGFSPAAGRSPHGTPHYGSPINTFTVRPGTRHPISYAYSGNHRKAPS
ncbi:uncharacterized protein C6orf132 homolog [Puma concolor]|uniref:Uncharacterized protein C6orf132 homolog n=1 Tax=Puma concolor TaxID=9696 RepID=A0A6P6I151_PUMCO|nr:uncharacterized protein C6orf132 homolog [Puma concolor]